MGLIEYRRMEIELFMKDIYPLLENHEKIKMFYAFYDKTARTLREIKETLAKGGKRELYVYALERVARNLWRACTDLNIVNILWEGRERIEKPPFKLPREEDLKFAFKEAEATLKCVHACYSLFLKS